MLRYDVIAGSVDVSVVIRILNNPAGTPELGVVFDSPGMALEYRRELAANVAITEVSLAALTTAHTDGGFLHIGNGYYRLDLPDAACAAGVAGVVVHGVVTGMVVIGAYINLTPVPVDLRTWLGVTPATLISTLVSVFVPAGGLAAGSVTASALAADASTEINAAVLAILGTPAGASLAADLAAIEAQTDDIGAAGAGLTAVPWNAAWDAEVQSEAADALNAYDPPTRAELTSDINSVLAILGTPAGASLAADLVTIDNFVDGVEATLADATFGLSALETIVDDLEGRLSAALATQLAAHSLGVGRGVVDAGSDTTHVIIKTVNGVAADATDDHYKDRHIVFTSGALLLQACSITDYVGATKTATISTVTDTPLEDGTFVIV